MKAKEVASILRICDNIDSNCTVYPCKKGIVIEGKFDSHLRSLFNDFPMGTVSVATGEVIINKRIS